MPCWIYSFDRPCWAWSLLSRHAGSRQTYGPATGRRAMEHREGLRSIASHDSYSLFCSIFDSNFCSILKMFTNMFYQNAANKMNTCTRWVSVKYLTPFEIRGRRGVRVCCWICWGSSRFVVVRGAPPRDPEEQNSTPQHLAVCHENLGSGVVPDVGARSELLKNTSERIRAPGCIRRSPGTL